MKYKVEFIIDTELDSNSLASMLHDRLQGKITAQIIEPIGDHFWFDPKNPELVAISIPEEAKDIYFDVQNQDYYPHKYYTSLDYIIEDPDGGGQLTETAAYKSDFKVHGLDIEKLRIMLQYKTFNDLTIPGRKFVILRKI